ncbi:MAG: hypothetical protein HYY93_10145 [Planctomycetes bacterium]|nr:hypothetical protein [Planctomycetota bacterium]
MRTRSTLFVRLAAPLAIATLLQACGRADREAAPPDIRLPATELRIARVKGALPADDPASALWEQAREVAVPLLPQDVVEPRLTERGTEQLSLQALHDGARVAFRLVWKDAAPDGEIDLDKATDAVAIQLPATGDGGALPDSMMGQPGKPVHIVLWRYASQRIAAGEPHGVAALYPNAASDHYPALAAADESTREEMEKRYAPCRAAGNSTVVQRFVSAVEDLSAEGFGSLTPLPDQRSSGKGAHLGGEWRVVMARPLDLSAGSETSVRAGASSFIAVAVWDGGRGQVGARKMRSIWVPVEVGE